MALVAIAGGQALARQVVVPPMPGGVPDVGTQPSPAYDAAFTELAGGNFSGALEVATDEYGGCMKIGNQRWIDSIAAGALVGECQFERGDFGQAVAAYDGALALAAQHPDWLLAVRFPQQPLQPVARRQATWGASRRGTRPAQLPTEVPIRQQAPDPQDVLRQGGRLAAPFDHQIRAQEIMRALVIAIYRRGDILGETGREAKTLADVTRALQRRSAPPNHYSQSWIDVCLGTALWAQGKPDEAARAVERGLVIGQGLDHALTPWGLIVLGRIALDSDRAADAATAFEEATYAAADTGDARALEEAFRLAFAAHMLAGARGVPRTIGAAGDAIRPRDGLDVLRARLLAMRAEALAAAGDARAATAALRAIDPLVLRGEPGRSTVGAEAAYAAALANLAGGNLAAGTADLEKALVLARPRSRRLFQTTRLVADVSQGSVVSDRQAELLLGRLLGSPTPRDFGLDPLDTLAVISTPRAPAFEAWIAVAARRGGPGEAVLDAVEAARRDRWLTARPLGGRLTAATRLLAADPEALDPQVAATRAAILATRPTLGPLLARLAERRAALAAAAVAAGRPDGAAAGPAALAGQPAEWADYGGGAAEIAAHAARLASGREAITPDFPPLLPATEIRRRLGAGQYLLSFHWTSAGLTGVLESRDRFVTWEVPQPEQLVAEIRLLARGLCLFDPQARIGTDKLGAAEWRGPAARIERMLFSKVQLFPGDGIDELVIVPDGWLWYVPFEILPAASRRPDAAGAAPRLIGEACEVRYCPTRSLAVASFTAPPLHGPIGIHAGRMARADDAATVAAVLDRTTAGIDRAVPVALSANGPPAALVASIFDALAAFDESGAGDAAAAIVPPAGGRGGLTFADWLGPPAKRPRIVLLPGLDTAMADGLKDRSLPARPGDDVFLPALDLLAAGAHTAVLSRWRVGGDTCTRLMTEFLRDSTAPPADPPDTAARQWRRAVDLVTAEPPDLEREPRLRFDDEHVLADGRHPFLWAGYLLVDCGSGSVPPADAARPAAAPAGPAAPPAAPAPAVQPAAPAGGAAP